MIPFILLIISILGMIFHAVTWYWIALCIISVIWLLLKLGGGGGAIADLFDIDSSFFD